MAEPAVTSRTEFMVLSLLGHVGLARVRSTLSPWLPQNSPHPAPPVSLLARVVLSGWPFFSVHSYRFPIDALDDVLLTAHMTQHLIFMSVAPPLLLLGAPVVPFLRSLPRWLLHGALGPLFRMAWLHRLFRLLTHPVFAWLAMDIAYLGWHIPVAYELAVRSDDWHTVEHLCFLVTGLLFWFPLIQPWPSVSRGSRWAMLPYLVGADLVNTAYSASLSFSRRVIYPSYAAAPRIFDISPLADQAAAGALMWVIGSIFYLVPLAVIAVQLLSPRGASSRLTQQTLV